MQPQIYPPAPANAAAISSTIRRSLMGCRLRVSVGQGIAQAFVAMRHDADSPGANQLADIPRIGRVSLDSIWRHAGACQRVRISTTRSSTGAPSGWRRAQRCKILRNEYLATGLPDRSLAITLASVPNARAATASLA